MSRESAGVVVGPEAQRRMAEGFLVLAELLGRTLGPQGRVVWNQLADGTPEAIENSATLARRVVELPDRCASIGAMMLRHLVWTVNERFGDGCATAAVLAGQLLRAGTRLLAAGVEPVELRLGIEEGHSLARQELERQARPVSEARVLAGIARSASGDAEIGQLLGELFDMVRDEGAVTVEMSPGRGLDREYVRGGLWPAHAAARLIHPDGAPVTVIDRPRVVVADAFIEGAEDVRPLLRAAVGDGRSLLIVCRALKSAALNLVSANVAQGRLHAAAIVPKSTGDQLTDDLNDIALLTGAVPLATERGCAPASATAEMCGAASRAVLHPDRLLLVGGAGEPDAIRRRVAHLRRRLLSPERLEATQRRELRARLARLVGGIGILKVGGSGERDQELRQQAAERAVRAVELAVAEGAVAGGGIALLACTPAVRAAAGEATGPRAAGLGLFADALEAPMRQLIRNSSREPGPVAAKLLCRSDSRGYNAISSELTSDGELLDPLPVVRGALEAATSGALAALGCAAVVLPPKGRQEVNIRP